MIHEGLPEGMACRSGRLALVDTTSSQAVITDSERIPSAVTPIGGSRWIPEYLSSMRFETEVIAVPVRASDHTIVGAIAAAWTRVHQNRAPTELLDTVAGLIGQTLDRVRLASAEHASPSDSRAGLHVHHL